MYFTLYFYVYFLIYIYQSYINHYYNNNHYTMGIFSCPCVVCPGGGVCAGSRGLLKFSQVGRCWQAGKYWKRCIGEAVSEVKRCWGFFSAENNGGVGGRWQFLTVYIKNVIISVATITKMLFVTRPPNLRCTAFLPLGV